MSAMGIVIVSMGLAWGGMIVGVCVMHWRRDQTGQTWRTGLTGLRDGNRKRVRIGRLLAIGGTVWQ